MALETGDAAPGELLHGQAIDRAVGVAEQFTEQKLGRADADTLLGNPNTEITPKDANASTVRTFIPPTQAELDAAAVVLHDNITFQLPDVLESVTAYYTQAAANGESSETGDGATTGSTGALSISLSTGSQGSASIAGTLVIKITPTPATDVPTTVYLFYVPDTSTRAQVLTKLTEIVGEPVLDWPRFQPMPAILFQLAQQVDISAKASLSQSATISNGSTSARAKSEGTATSKSIGVSLREVTVPPTIHEAITITHATTVTQEVTASASVTVTRSGAGWLDATYWPERTITTNPNPITATAAATTLSEDFTDTIPATPGLTGIPQAGKYARIKMEPWKYGFAQVRAEVVDFSYFA